MKIIEIISLIIKLKNTEFMSELCKHNLFHVLFKLFEKHDWNNLLHTYFEKIIHHTLQSDFDNVKKSMLKDF